jgi:signal transduction histidine kinase
VPLRFNNATDGILSAQSRHPNRFSSEDLTRFLEASHWVAMVAHWVGLAETGRWTETGGGTSDTAEELVAVLAHELGILLTPLQGRLGVLERRLSANGRGPALDDVEEAARAVAGTQELVALVLDVSRLGHGSLGQSLQLVDLGRLVADVAKELNPMYPQVLVSATAEASVTGDPLRLREAVVNLISHAVQHSPPRSLILLGTGREQREGGEWAVVSVVHEGNGIGAEAVPHLVEQPRDEGGMSSPGIGLFVSRRVIEAHGGTLTVRTAADHGATILMAIPVHGI